jgi:threonine/homoserine/homoserine lactone efflux protein
VLLFRTLTFGIQIPLGGFTYLIWRGNKGWRRRAPDEEEAQTSAVVSG